MTKSDKTNKKESTENLPRIIRQGNITFDRFREYPVYDEDLGVFYSPKSTKCRLWSPTANEVKIRVYEKSTGGKATETYNLSFAENGLWSITLEGYYLGKFYTFQIRVGTTWLLEVPDYTAKAVGVNGKRGAIIDIETTNPKDWNLDQRPELLSFADTIIYEAHIRDLTMHKNSGIKNRGKFLGLTEENTTGPNKEKTGLSHLKELGITHLHLLPIFDFATIDEAQPQKAQYNWGYDPQNYNVPEGSYATDAYAGDVRICELKQMVQKLHKNNIRVVIDVVYNHTSATEKSVFNQIVPNYFYRQDANGCFSDASGCGNEIASEREMVRRFIVESVTFWATEYHIDGFRFDLMGIHDIETMKEIRAALDKIDPTILVYGEGWAAGTSPFPENDRAVKANINKISGVAAFNDDLRDAVKGHWSHVKERGFVSAKSNMEQSVRFGVVGGITHSQIDFAKVNYSNSAWANSPLQSINYVSCHDNNTLWDKLKISNRLTSRHNLENMHKLSTAIVLTAQGIPFLHSGVEMLRSKYGEHNSYKSSDSINQINWKWKFDNKQIFDYTKTLINIRLKHSAFRMPSAKMVQKHLSFLDFQSSNIVGFQINDNANGDLWGKIIVVYNANEKDMKVRIPKGDWTIVATDYLINEKGVRTITDEKVFVLPISIQFAA